MSPRRSRVEEEVVELLRPVQLKFIEAASSGRILSQPVHDWLEANGVDVATAERANDDRLEVNDTTSENDFDATPAPIAEATLKRLFSREAIASLARALQSDGYVSDAIRRPLLDALDRAEYIPDHLTAFESGPDEEANVSLVRVQIERQELAMNPQAIDPTRLSQFLDAVARIQDDRISFPVRDMALRIAESRLAAEPDMVDAVVKAHLQLADTFDEFDTGRSSHLILALRSFEEQLGGPLMKRAAQGCSRVSRDLAELYDKWLQNIGPINESAGSADLQGESFHGAETIASRLTDAMAEITRETVRAGVLLAALQPQVLVRAGEMDINDAEALTIALAGLWNSHVAKKLPSNELERLVTGTEALLEMVGEGVQPALQTNPADFVRTVQQTVMGAEIPADVESIIGDYTDIWLERLFDSYSELKPEHPGARSNGVQALDQLSRSLMTTQSDRVIDVAVGGFLAIGEMDRALGLLEYAQVLNNEGAHISVNDDTAKHLAAELDQPDGVSLTNTARAAYLFSGYTNAQIESESGELPRHPAYISSSDSQGRLLELLFVQAHDEGNADLIQNIYDISYYDVRSPRPGRDALMGLCSVYLGSTKDAEVLFNRPGVAEHVRSRLAAPAVSAIRSGLAPETSAAVINRDVWAISETMTTASGRNLRDGVAALVPGAPRSVHDTAPTYSPEPHQEPTFGNHGSAAGSSEMDEPRGTTREEGIAPSLEGTFEPGGKPPAARPSSDALQPEVNGPAGPVEASASDSPSASDGTEPEGPIPQTPTGAAVSDAMGNRKLDYFDPPKGGNAGTPGDALRLYVQGLEQRRGRPGPSPTNDIDLGGPLG